jgi:hypothetical protein
MRIAKKQLNKCYDCLPFLILNYLFIFLHQIKKLFEISGEAIWSSTQSEGNFAVFRHKVRAKKIA